MAMETPAAAGERGYLPTVTCKSCGAPFTPAVPEQALCDRCQGLAQPEPPRSPLQQTEVAGFKMVHELGAGRFATSWLAEDKQGLAVVLKLLRRYAPDPNAVQRFLAEAQRIAGAPELDHPNVARLATGGVHLVQAFFLVYQSGGELTLADELRSRGRVLASRALELCAQLAEGLNAAHRGGVLHLDLKPANVGLARLADGTEQAVLLDVATSHLLHKAGIPEAGPLPLASAAYTSPEEAAGKPVDARSDLYSLGVLLFQLVSGRLPIMGQSADELLKAHRDHPALKLRDVGRRVHNDFEALLQRVLAKDPAQRPSSGDELAVLFRAVAPVADTAPMEDGDEGAVEDPVPVVALPRPEPEIVAHKVQPVDPALERAMMGEVQHPPAPEAPPGIPKWAPWVAPVWLPRALIASGALVLIVLASLWLSSRRPRRPRAAVAPPPVASVQPEPAAPAPAVAQPSAAPAERAATAPAAEKTSPAETAATAAERTAPAERGAPAASQESRAPAASEKYPEARVAVAKPSPYAKDFDRAQKALWTGQAAAAESILGPIVKNPKLSKKDKARASKLMADAQLKKGNKFGAIDWYKKALKATDDAAEKDKLQKALSAIK